MKDNITKKYTNGEITVVWKPGTCIHSTICWNALTGNTAIFNPSERPWIKMDGGTTEQIIKQVKKCPSGALSYYVNSEENTPEVAAPAETAQSETSETIVEVTRNGPLMVYGNITVRDKEGNAVQKNKVTALCRCGASSNKPYCDGAHVKVGFKG